MDKRIIRVFPRKTKLTPDDPYAFVGYPPFELWRPEADGVHVSCCFTWDKAKAERLADAWSQYYPVKLGGPAIEPYNGEFIPGRYIRHGVTFTSRGCKNNCPHCLVPEREGKLREIKGFAPGHIIQDNNLLQCSHEHISKVFDMLKVQRRAAIFSGGLDSTLIDDCVVELLGSIRIKKLFLAADTKSALEPLRVAMEMLKPLGLSREKLRCYVLIGRNESISQAIERLEAVWRIGCLPFAQLFQPPDEWIEYSPAWKKLARLWERPAATKAIHRKGGGD